MLLSFRCTWVISQPASAREAGCTQNPWFWLVTKHRSVPHSTTGWFCPRCPYFNLYVRAPIASAILIHAGATRFYWKIAFDERYAAYSPGMQLMLDASRLMLADPDFTMADSCSMPGSSGIEAIWKGRRRMADLLIGMPGLGFAVTAEIETARRGLRAGAKGVYRKVEGMMGR